MPTRAFRTLDLPCFLVASSSYSAARRTVTTQVFLQIIRQSECANLNDSRASRETSYCCKLNTVAWVVELTYLHVVVTCESLSDGNGKVRCTVRPLGEAP